MNIVEQVNSSPKRKRGAILSSQGWQRLQAAEHLSSLRDNEGRTYTLEQLSERTGLSTNTLTKVRRRQKPVDHPTLEAYFKAFDLTVTADDCLGQDQASMASALTTLQQTPTKGPLELDSPFYIYRPPAERLCTEEVMKPGSLIRIKGPHQYGKTSLMSRIISYAEDRDFRIASLSFQLADRQVLSDLDAFLRWFCTMVSRSLDMPNEVKTRWDPLFGGSYSCSDYFESYLLPASSTPLLLVLDEVNTIFNHPEIAVDFFGMLRAWYEQGRHRGGVDIWQRLRMVIVHSAEVYLPLNVHQSPFNVGLLIDLPPFTVEHVQELASRYHLSSPKAMAKTLVNLLGGNPYLTQLAFSDLSQRSLTADQLLKTAIAPDGIFSSHLRQLFGRLEADPDLMDGMKQVLQHNDGAILHPTQAFKLQGLGLVTFANERAVPSCDLYQRYFSLVLSES